MGQRAEKRVRVERTGKFLASESPGCSFDCTLSLFNASCFPSAEKRGRIKCAHHDCASAGRSLMQVAQKKRKNLGV